MKQLVFLLCCFVLGALVPRVTPTAHALRCPPDLFEIWSLELESVVADESVEELVQEATEAIWLSEAWLASTGEMGIGASEHWPRGEGSFELSGSWDVRQ